MKERPILFQGAMVRAILAGTKTQTRRLVKGTALEWLQPENFTPEFVASPENHLCPYGFPGDRLWVRETWARVKVAQDATGSDWIVFREGDNRTDYGGPWKPGIHLFRKDARLLLEVTGVRVERLQAISDADALAEGVDQTNTSICGYATERYRHLWEQINGSDSWNANPWVWVVEFKRMTSNPLQIGQSLHEGAA